ncbi:putative surface protease GP63 [Trypanosoma cruzi]|uniref:Leishmanolysin-like peptidase n=1 Tax=Trypanosoma cruzi TaxID=5693 RepID=A0A2V2XFR0_TRYCR|nr:putative surface protease GP63 [Trypanosoma cruzi]PWV19356.1 putative surface protease GP63 [Trypanosoma cruzi]
MRQPRHTAPLPLLLPWLMMVVCCAGVCVAADRAVKHRCGFDAMMKKYGRLPTAVVREVPRRGQGAVQAYTAASEDEDDGWAPIRIRVSAEDMYNPLRHCTAAGDLRIDHDGRAITCEEDDVLTEERRSIVLRQILPAAIQLHAERLSVRPVTRPVLIPRTGLGICDNFTIPHKHHTVGVAGADMILYANAFPTSDPAAWAASCVWLDDGRPFAAAVNFDPRQILVPNEDVRVAAHELGHALGFYVDYFVMLHMISEVPNVRGMLRVSVISTPKTKAMARQYHNCSTLEGIELEDEGGCDTVLSHWKKRNMRDEMMTSDVGVGLYSALTLAAFEDMGVYVANYSAAEMLWWGNNSGCGLLEKKCLTDGITEYPDLFCNQFDENVMFFCTYDRLSLGFCRLMRHEEALPQEYQYFADPRVGGDGLYMSRCPYVKEYSNGGCTNGDPSAMLGSVVGPNSRCVKGQDLQFDDKYIGDVCVDTRCGDGTVSVRFLRDDAWHECQEGETVTPPSGPWRGSVVCPQYADVCTAFPNISGHPIPVVDPPLADDPTSAEGAEGDEGETPRKRQRRL